MIVKSYDLIFSVVFLSDEFSNGRKGGGPRKTGQGRLGKIYEP